VGPVVAEVVEVAEPASLLDQAEQLALGLVDEPLLIAGQGACPPEDVGGPWGYDEFQAALTDPSHPEHDERLEWAGGPFDPLRFDLDDADRALEWLAWRPLTSVS
jgi:hypothetical protein